MGDRLPVDFGGLKAAVLVGGGLLALLVAGQVLRLVSRFLAWSVLALVVALAAYVAYELYAGWTASARDRESGYAATTNGSVDDPIRSVQREYTEGSLSEAELERELDQLLDDADRDGDREVDYER
ncbi:hypothetical protein [Halostella litorea]|uniref:hypothetical protein n=1 Tax=Halostella litorea TaxID=2528831 RepID=UPI0010922010|nr:hypothetical protein [Halostella litorea]